jgi:hypothetical protein
MTTLTKTGERDLGEGTKRQYFPYVLEHECSKCGDIIERDFSWDYISHPEFGTINKIYIYCENCENEDGVEVIPRLTLELVEE